MTLEYAYGKKRHNPKVTVIEGLVRKELLRAEEVQAVEVLSSVRRIAGIFYAGNVIEMLNDSKRFNTTLEDVSTDLDSFRSISVSAEDVQKGLSFWQGIISSHYDYIELFLQSAYTNSLNTEEIREVLQLYVEDQIFRLIPLPLDNPSLLADTIIDEIKKRFSFQGFRYAILNSFEKVHPKNTVSIDQKNHHDDENHIERLVTPEGQQTVDDFLLENFSRLSRQQREIILLYLDGFSEQEMKEDYGYTTAEIEQLRAIISQQFLVKDPQSTTMPENIETENPITVEAAEKEFFTVARQNSLDRIISLLCNIDDYGLYAFLSRFGYMGNRDYQEYAASWGSSQTTYKNDYIRALNKIVSLLSKPLEQIIDSSIPLLELVLNLQSQKVTHVTDRPKRLAYSSRRIMFSKTNALGDPTYRSKLTDRQIEVTRLMSERIGNVFVYSATDIADQLGISESSISLIFASAYLIFKNPDTQRLIGRDGKPLRSHQQKTLILFRKNGLTPFQSANLSPVQKIVFDMSTDADEMGRYKTIENEVMGTAGLHRETFAKFAKRIVRNLEDVSTIITFKQALDFALEHRERYSEREFLAIQKAREMIENGIPLRNQTGPGISYKNLAIATGISREDWKRLSRGKIDIRAFDRQKRINSSRVLSTEKYALLSPSQKELIAITRSGLTNIQLASLSSYQRKALDALTTPDENGWYVSMTTAMRKITRSDKRDSFSKTVQRIIEGLVNTSAVEELQQALTYAISNPRQFSENELRAIQIAREMIERGMPIMSRKRNSISYKTLSETTGMNYTTCSHFFRRKIINYYQKALPKK